MAIEGFDNKPPEVKEAIQKGDRETLRRLGRKGAEKRVRNKENRETAETFYHNEEFKKIYESQLESLKKTYPQLDYEGNEIEEGWHEAEAERITTAIFRMRERQETMEKGLQAKR